MLNRSLEEDIFGRPGKKCPMCGRLLEHWQFGNSRNAKDGLQSYCKDCQKKYRQKNPFKQYKKNRNDQSLNIWNEEI